MTERIKEFISENKYNIFISTMFILSVYLIKVISLATSIDNEAAISVPHSLYSAWLSMGRVTLVYLKKIFGLTVYNPFFTMFMLITLMVFSTVIWGMIFDYVSGKKRKFKYWIFSSVFFTSPIMAEQFGFVMQAVEVLVAIDIVGINLYFFYKYFIEKKNTIFLLINILFTGLAFSVYQAITTIYVTAAICLFILYITREDVTDTKEIWKFIVCIMLSFAASYIVYYLLAKLVFLLKNIQETNYTGDQVSWGILSVKDCLKNIYYYIKNTIMGYSIFYSKIYLIVAPLLVLNTFYKKKEYFKNKYYLYILAIFALLITPFLMGIILGGEPTKRTSISHPFMIAFSIMYIYSEIEKYIKNKRSLPLILCLIAYVPFYQGVASSRLYYTEYITNKESEIIATKISDKIEEITGSYLPQQKVVFIGCMQLNRNNSCYELSDLEYVGRSFFETSFSTTHGSFLMRNYLSTLGIEYLCPSDEDARKAEEYAKNMPQWPDKSSIQKLDDMVIVKLS